MVGGKDAQRRASRRRPRRQEAAGYRPRVVVKFHDYVDLPYEDGAEGYVEELQVGPWRRLVEEFPGITLKRLYTSLDPEKIAALANRATELGPCPTRGLPISPRWCQLPSATPVVSRR